MKLFNNLTNYHLTKENGIALAMAIYIIIIFSVLGVVISAMMLSLDASSKQEIAGMKAYYIAQAGIEYDFNQLKSDTDWSDNTDYTKSFTSSPDSSDYPTFTIDYNYPLIAAWDLDGDRRDISGTYKGVWHFDEGTGTTAYDATQNSNDGTLTNGPSWTTGRTTKFGNAISLDGSDDYISIPHTSDLSSSVFGTSDVFSLEAWVYPQAWADWAAIINKASAGSWSNTTNGLWSYTGGFRCVMGCSVSGNPAGSYIGIDYKPALDNWYYIACTADGSYLRMYANGEEVGNVAISTLTYSRSTNTSPVTIGRRSTSVAPSFNGIIDEVRILSTTLNAAQVADRYGDYVAGFVEDSTGNGNDGYTHNMDLGTCWVSGQNAKFGSALDSDNTNDYVSLPDDLGYTNEVSAFAWFKSDGSPAGSYHIIMGGQELEISVHDTGYLRTGVYTTDGRFVNNYGSGLTDGNWHYIGFTFDGSTKKSYIDGVYSGSQDVTGTLTTDFSDRTLVKYGSSTSYYLNGKIDSIRIYNTVLDPDEIADHYDATVGDRSPKPFNVKQYNMVTSTGKTEETFSGSSLIIQRQIKVRVPKID